MSADHPQRLWAPWAWLAKGWAADVLLEVGADGCWRRITPASPRPSDLQPLQGALLPGMVNAHSHAFQRAFAGLAERREAGQDDFWSWRERMYAVASRITASQLQAVAEQLYSELLAGGYTQVCEFHYLQEAPDGRGDDTLAMTEPLVSAAQAVGIGLTLIPVVYERAGFAQDEPRPAQQRFLRGAAQVHALAERITARAAALPAGAAPLNAGVGLHSLRAAKPASIAELAKLRAGVAGPIHIHVSEQYAEVAECLAHTGKRPIEWLVSEGLLDERWSLVHATHAAPAEIAAVAHSGAAVVICPSTEGNLGDGFTDVPRWLNSGVPLAIGSDSHVTRAWPEELRWLEYGQRLLLRQRNVTAAPQQGEPSTATRLFARALAGGAHAAGQRVWGLEVGARADALLLDLDQDALIGIQPSHALDALVFSSPCARPFAAALVAGRWALHPEEQPGAAEAAAQRRHGFAQAMGTLLSE